MAYLVQDVQNKQAQAQNLLPAGAKRSIADFGNGFDHTTWKVTQVGAPEGDASEVFDRGQDKAELFVTKNKNFRFRGTPAGSAKFQAIELWQSAISYNHTHRAVQGVVKPFFLSLQVTLLSRTPF